MAAARPPSSPSPFSPSQFTSLRRTTRWRVVDRASRGCIAAATRTRTSGDIRRPLMSESVQSSSVTTPCEERVQGFDCIELCVSNAHQAAHFFRTAFGFDVVQRAGPDTGSRDAASLMLADGGVRLVVTSALGQGAVADHVHRHGDSVSNVGLRVDDVEAAFDRAVKAGAAPIQEPRRIAGRDGTMRRAMVGTPGDLVHSLIERDGEAFLPDAVVVAPTRANGRAGFRA